MLEYDIELLKDVDSSFEDEFNRHSKLVKFKKGESLFLDGSKSNPKKGLLYLKKYIKMIR